MDPDLSLLPRPGSIRGDRCFLSRPYPSENGQVSCQTRTEEEGKTPSTPSASALGERYFTLQMASMVSTSSVERIEQRARAQVGPTDGGYTIENLLFRCCLA